MSAGLPFAHLNLRANPFGEQEPGEQAATAVIDVADLAERLRQPGQAVQVVGPCGRGKTTTLLALRAALPEATWHRADTAGDRPPAGARPLLLDEADRVSFVARWRLLRGAGSAAVAVHSDHTRELRWLGFEVHTRCVGALDTARLDAIVRRRIEAVRRGPGPVPHLDAGGLRRLIAQHGDDLRAIRVALYARFQRLEGVGRVEV